MAALQHHTIAVTAYPASLASPNSALLAPAKPDAAAVQHSTTRTAPLAAAASANAVVDVPTPPAAPHTNTTRSNAAGTHMAPLRTSGVARRLPPRNSPATAALYARANSSTQTTPTAPVAAN